MFRLDPIALKHFYVTRNQLHSLITIFKNHSSTLWFFLFFIGYSFNGLAQQKIEIIQSNELVFDKSKGSDAKKLIGDVIFKHNETFLHCDSAYFYNSQNKVNAYSNVKITKGDSLVLTGDSLFYDGESANATMMGKVKLSTPEQTLEAPLIKFNRTSNIASYFGNGVINNLKDSSVIYSKTGFYFINNKEFLFKTNVEVTSKDYIISSDSLIYFEAKEQFNFIGKTTIITDSAVIKCNKGEILKLEKQSFFYGKASITTETTFAKADTIYLNEQLKTATFKHNALIADSTNETILGGNYLFLNNTDSSFLAYSNAYIGLNTDGADTLFIHGDTLKSAVDTSNQKLIKAYYHAQFYKTDFQGKCDSLQFNTNDSTFYLFGTPYMWNENNQINGTTIEFTLKNRAPNELLVHQNAFVIAVEDSGKYNQLFGTNLKGIFKNSALHTIFLNKNAETIYWVEEDSTKYLGVNSAKCENIRIQLDSSKVKTITFLAQPQAQLIPLSKAVAENPKIKGFTWLEAIRPKRFSDIFIWKDPNETPKP